MNTVEEIKAHLEYGDWRKIGKLAGITRKHALVAITRPGSKHYNDVFKAAKEVAQANVGLGI